MCLNPVNEEFDRAYANVGLLANDVWSYSKEKEDIDYKKANLCLWIRFNEVEKRLIDDEISQDIRPAKSVPVRTVRDVIPNSRLATYSNYEYNEERERMYVVDVGTPKYNQNSCHEGHKELEVWMLPEVEKEFRKYTQVPHSGWYVSNPRILTRGEAIPTEQTATTNQNQWLSITHWSDELLSRYSDKSDNLRHYAQRSQYDEDFFCPTYEADEVAQKREEYPCPRYLIETNLDHKLHNALNSQAVRNLWATPNYNYCGYSSSFGLNAEVPEFQPVASSSKYKGAVENLENNPPMQNNVFQTLSPGLSGEESGYNSQNQFESIFDITYEAELFPYSNMVEYPVQPTEAPTVQSMPVFLRSPEQHINIQQAKPAWKKQQELILPNSVPVANTEQCCNVGPMEQQVEPWNPLAVVSPQREVSAMKTPSAEKMVAFIDKWLNRKYNLRSTDITAMTTSSCRINNIFPNAKQNYCLDQNSTSRQRHVTMKRPLYRDVLMGGVNTVSISESKFDELEQEALEQYSGSDTTLKSSDSCAVQNIPLTTVSSKLIYHNSETLDQYPGCDTKLVTTTSLSSQNVSVVRSKQVCHKQEGLQQCYGSSPMNTVSTSLTGQNFSAAVNSVSSKNQILHKFEILDSEKDPVADLTKVSLSPQVMEMKSVATTTSNQKHQNCHKQDTVEQSSTLNPITPSSPQVPQNKSATSVNRKNQVCHKQEAIEQNSNVDTTPTTPVSRSTQNKTPTAVSRKHQVFLKQETPEQSTSSVTPVTSSTPHPAQNKSATGSVVNLKQQVCHKQEAQEQCSGSDKTPVTITNAKKNKTAVNRKHQNLEKEVKTNKRGSKLQPPPRSLPVPLLAPKLAEFSSRRSSQESVRSKLSHASGSKRMIASGVNINQDAYCPNKQAKWMKQKKKKPEKKKKGPKQKKKVNTEPNRKFIETEIISINKFFELSDLFQETFFQHDWKLIQDPLTAHVKNLFVKCLNMFDESLEWFKFLITFKDPEESHINIKKRLELARSTVNCSGNILALLHQYIYCYTKIKTSIPCDHRLYFDPQKLIKQRPILCPLLEKTTENELIQAVGLLRTITNKKHLAKLLNSINHKEDLSMIFKHDWKLPQIYDIPVNKKAYKIQVNFKEWRVHLSESLLEKEFNPSNNRKLVKIVEDFPLWYSWQWKFLDGWKLQGNNDNFSFRWYNQFSVKIVEQTATSARLFVMCDWLLDLINAVVFNKHPPSYELLWNSVYPDQINSKMVFLKLLLKGEKNWYFGDVRINQQACCRFYSGCEDPCCVSWILNYDHISVTTRSNISDISSIKKEEPAQIKPIKSGSKKEETKTKRSKSKTKIKSNQTPEKHLISKKVSSEKISLPSEKSLGYSCVIQ